MAISTLPASFQFPDQNSYSGPFEASDGTIYVIGRDANAQGAFLAASSTDGGSTWSVSSATTNPLTSPFASIWAWQHGDILHVAGQTFEVGSMNNFRYIYYKAFDAATKGWLGSYSQVAAVADSGAYSACSISVREGIEPAILIAAQGPEDAIMGTSYSRVHYFKSIDGGENWSAATPVDGGGEKNHTGPVSTVGASDRVHFCWFDRTGTDLMHRSLSSGDALDTAVLVESGALGLDYNPVGILYDSTTGEIHVQFVYWTGPHIYGSTATSAADPVFSSSSYWVTEHTVESTPGGQEKIASSVISGTDQYQYVFYADRSTDDLWYAKNSGSGWPLVDVEVVDNTTISHVSAGSLSGVRKIGFIYDNGVDILYGNIPMGEILPLGSAAETETALKIGHEHYLRPNQDVTTASWTGNDGGTTNIYSYVDEAVPDDTDYIYDDAGVGETATLRLGLTDLPDPGQDGGHFLRFRVKSEATGGL